MKIADENLFKPTSLLRILERNAKALHKDIHSLNAGLQKGTAVMLNKKRTQADLNQIKIYERQSEASRKTASKSKLDPNSQPAANNQTPIITEERKQSEESEEPPFDVEKEIQRRKDEREF